MSKQIVDIDGLSAFLEGIRLETDEKIVNTDKTIYSSEEPINQKNGEFWVYEVV